MYPTSPWGGQMCAHCIVVCVAVEMRESSSFGSGNCPDVDDRSSCCIQTQHLTLSPPQYIPRKGANNSIPLCDRLCSFPRAHYLAHEHAKRVPSRVQRCRAASSELFESGSLRLLLSSPHTPHFRGTWGGREGGMRLCSKLMFGGEVWSRRSV